MTECIKFPNSTSKNVQVIIEKTITGYKVKIDDEEYSQYEILSILAHYNESDATEILMLIKIALKRLKLDKLSAYGTFTNTETTGTPIYKAKVTFNSKRYPVEIQVHPHTLQFLIKTPNNRVFTINPERLIEIALDHGLLLNEK